MGLNARNTDPNTSHSAEELLADLQGRHMAIVYQDLYRNGPGTQSELARRTGLRPDQVWRRLSDLEREGLIEYAGLDRPGDSNRLQRVMRIRGREGSVLAVDAGQRELSL